MDAHWRLAKHESVRVARGDNRESLLHVNVRILLQPTECWAKYLNESKTLPNIDRTKNVGEASSKMDCYIF